MKTFRPGASIHGDFAYICDYCEKDDGRPVYIWKQLHNTNNHFAICHECIEKLYLEILQQDPTNRIDVTVTRIVIPESLRNKIFDRDGNKCLKCGSTKNLSIDHITPFRKGGKTIESNLQTLCKSCNSRKGTKEVLHG